MGYVHERRAPIGERPLGRPTMGQVRVRPDPKTDCPFGPSGYSATRPLPASLTYEQQLERHCIREAQREVDCWLLGTVFHPEPFRYQKPWKPTESGVPRR